MSIESISSYLNSKPTGFVEKGTPISKREDSKLRTESIWMLESDCSPEEPLEDCLLPLLRFLEERDAVIQENRTQWEMDIFCGCWIDCDQTSNGLALDNSIIQRMAKFSLDLLIDIIPG